MLMSGRIYCGKKDQRLLTVFLDTTSAILSDSLLSEPFLDRNTSATQTKKEVRNRLTPIFELQVPAVEAHQT